MSDNREVEITDIGEGEPVDDGFGSALGDGRVKLNQSPPGLDEEMRPGRVIETDTLRRNIDPREINIRRSEEARVADSAKDAELTTDPLLWASNPDQYDFPGVDTGPAFREEQGDDFDTDGFLDDLF
jgi:hypothetical protein